MKIFEILNTPPQGQDPTQQQTQNSEDDDQGKFDADKVDNNLQNIAQGIDDENTQPDIPQGAESEPPELDSQNMEPIDDALLSQVKSLPYVTSYDFEDTSKLNPMAIAKMSIADLSSLKNQVLFKIQTTTMQNTIGIDNDKMTKYCNDLLQFVNRVMTFKRTSTKDQMAQTNSSPPYQTQQ